LATRSPFVANRGSSARAGSPRARQNRGHCRSLPTATAIVPSAVSNVSYGTMFGWALPSRPGADPPTNAFWAWLTSAASVEPRSVRSIRCPPFPSRGVERGEDRHGAVQPGQDVAERDADLRRAGAGLAVRPGR
jgi:hypothetical protein